jgi:hypothetical protein
MIQGKSPSLVQNRMGMMAQVVESGIVKVGDAVRVVEKIVE